MRALTMVLLASIILYLVCWKTATPKRIQSTGLDFYSENFQAASTPYKMPLPEIYSQSHPASFGKKEPQNNLENLILDLKTEHQKINKKLAMIAEEVKQTYRTAYTLGCETDDDCNTIRWDDSKKNICRVDHTCACEVGSGSFCTVPTKYKDPNVMTLVEKNRFKFQNDLSNFTSRDYANWLMLYKNTPEELTLDHLKNLQLLLRGVSLPKDIPTRRESPPQSVKQYLDLLDAGKALAIKDVNLDSGVYLPSNYTAYEKFVPPKELTRVGQANTDAYKQVELSNLSSKITPQILPKLS